MPTKPSSTLSPGLRESETVTLAEAFLFGAPWALAMAWSLAYLFEAYTE